MEGRDNLAEFRALSAAGVNDVWLDMTPARQLGQVSETVDPYMDMLDLATGRPLIEWDEEEAT